MSEKFQKIVNAPHRAVGKLGRKIKGTNPQNAGAKIARGTGIGISAMTQFLLWLAKYVTLDNHITRAGEKLFSKIKVGKNKNGTDKKLSKFIKRNPNFTSIVSWWMLLGSITGVGFGIKNKDKIVDAVKDKIENIKGRFFPNTDEDENMIALDKIYSTESTSFKTDVVNENWSEIVVGLLEFETYRGANPIKQPKESRYTYGPGLTWIYEDGTQKPCIGEYVDKVKTFSDAQIWDQVRQHCLYDTEVLGVAQRALKDNGFRNVTNQQILGLFFAGYQTPASLANPMVNKLDKKGNVIKGKNGKPLKERIPGIIPKLKAAGNDTQKIIDAFMAGRDVNESWREGTNKRRWWCAMYYIGKISAVDFLSMDRDAFSRLEINTIMKNGHFVYDDSTIEYALSCKNPHTNSVHEFIASHSVLNDIEQNLENKVRHNEHKQQDKNPSVEQMRLGLAAYEANDYATAIARYQESINLDVDNMESYTGLAMAYKKQGDKTHSIDDYEKSLAVVRDCNKRMNANKSLLYDAEVKAITYHNAGLVHEEMAKIESKAGNTASANDHYAMAKKNFETARINAERAGVETAEYDSAIKRINKTIGKNKKTAFVNASARVKKSDKNTANKIIYENGVTRA